MSAHAPAVLFVCVGNGGKSQMAAAIARHLGGRRLTVHSAGTAPKSDLNALSVAALEEIGADVTGEFPKPVDPAIMAAADRVIVLGAEAALAPVPGMRAPIETWHTDEPSERGIEGVERMRLIRDDIAARVRALLADLDVPLTG
ncbi:arsenate-mycothiol transferase ArsC [Gephyromycinifex aptenodytis]|uniref:arsenate-mycothiol transferase ArsC n=1 Tax=Gephyromycinifex aptenodytis TaxID=2716227 RepID=UPI0014470712|nr:low molecular weight phosphatase family protein [Gephyromycinifex aptenodytis]